MFDWTNSGFGLYRQLHRASTNFTRLSVTSIPSSSQAVLVLRWKEESSRGPLVLLSEVLGSSTNLGIFLLCICTYMFAELEYLLLLYVHVVLLASVWACETWDESFVPG